MGRAGLRVEAGFRPFGSVEATHEFSDRRSARIGGANGFDAAERGRGGEDEVPALRPALERAGLPVRKCQPASGPTTTYRKSRPAKRLNSR